ncbi:MAG TPA: DNA-directed RNA polymerase subunit beta, partial [Syntrophales bacterium]|nr:DNA-directed RNA polymerase subunit beta [Syntrophales bacterium]
MREVMGELRKNFGRIKKIVDIPNLVEIQRKSYGKFLQMDVDPEKRGNFGLQGAFKSVFPIRDFSGKCSLEFVSYRIGDVKYDVPECIQKGMTYAAPLKIVVRLVVFDTERSGEQKTIRDIKEQEIYFGEIPLMTESGTFVVNGTERVIVSQLHRSPGIFFDHDKGKTHASGRLLYSARIIPIRGSWLDLEFDTKDVIYCRIDRRRKMPVTILLKAMGNTSSDLLHYFYNVEKVFLEGKEVVLAVDDALVGERAPRDIRDPETGEVIVKKGRKMTKATVKRLLEAKKDRIVVDDDYILGRIVADDVVDPETGEVLLRCNTELTMDKVEQMRVRGVKELNLIYIEDDGSNLPIRDTLLLDNIQTEEDAVIEIYRRLRPSNPPTLETAR